MIKWVKLVLIYFFSWIKLALIYFENLVDHNEVVSSARPFPIGKKETPLILLVLDSTPLILPESLQIEISWAEKGTKNENGSSFSQKGDCI